MRKDFARIAADRRRAGQWDEADEREIGTWVGSVIREGDEARIQACAEWLAACAWVVMEQEIERYKQERARFVAARPVLADQFEARQADREWERRCKR